MKFCKDCVQLHPACTLRVVAPTTCLGKELKTMKPDWHDRPTEPGLWLAKAGTLTAELVEIDDDAMQITPAEWGINVNKACPA